MKSKGFTLIELLAVIVILAVIALIATPLIMGTITKAKKNAFIDTANGIIKAGENYQAEQVMTTTGDVEDLVISDLTTDTKLQYKGSKPKSGQLKITSDGKTAIAIWSGQFCAVKNYDDKKVLTLKEVPEYFSSLVYCIPFQIIAAKGRDKWVNPLDDVRKEMNDMIGYKAPKTGKELGL